MRLFLQFFSLTDRYERKVRLLPGLILAAGPALTAGALLQEAAVWYKAASAAVGIEFLAAILLGHLARARGRKIEDQLVAAWGGFPTLRWLRPWDSTCSHQQKAKWRSAIKRLTGLTIPAGATGDRSHEEIDQIITDATRQLRYILREHPKAGLLRSHNEDYGFARNLCAVRWLWVTLSALCLAASLAAIGFGLRSYVAILVSLAMLVASILISIELPVYVKRCAERYAESLFAMTMLPAGTKQTSAKRPKDAANSHK